MLLGVAMLCKVPLAVTVSWPKTVMGQFTGRIYVFVGRSPDLEPRLGPDWKSPGPIFISDVKQAKPDTEVDIDATDATGLLPSLPSGEYTFQAVIDRNPASPRVGDGDGNLYSAPVRTRVEFGGAQVKLVCDQVIDEPAIHPTGIVKVVELESILLSNAQRRSVVWRAALVLPNEFASQPDRKFPMVIDIPDRSDSWTNYPDRDTNKAAYRDGKPVIYLRLDPVSASGYHYLADSANNGPYARALISELLPYVAKEYRGDAGRMILTGAGSGAWSALWLQATNPTSFAGCWAFDPDSVDFHTVHGLNLYADSNALLTVTNGWRSWSREQHDGWAAHAGEEKVLRGLSLVGWESDFSPKGKNQKPMPLFDRATGTIDPAVAKAWEGFDLTAYLQGKWNQIGKEVGPKLHVFGSEGDLEFRTAALTRLRDALNSLGGDGMLVRIGPAPMESIAHAEAAACYPGR